MADFGPWARVTDCHSAGLSERMAGLPVFLLGLISVQTAGMVLLTGAGFDTPVTAPYPLLIGVASGLALIGLGLALRGCNAALVPLAALLTLANAALTLWIAALWTLLVQAIIVLVAISGLRGWWWLRKHSA